jgi:dolichyl-phosphate-mannose-protein mannosyltransferase
MSAVPVNFRPRVTPLFYGDLGKKKRLTILTTLAFLSAFCLWILPLGSSLWLDELVTYWTAYKGVVPAIARSQFWPGQNMAYSALMAEVIRIGGSNEVVLRLPSLVAVVLTAWMLFRLVEHFLDKEAALLVIVVFASLHTIAKDAASNARPYAIAVALVVGSVLQLVRWLDNQRWRNMFGFVFLAALIPYFQVVFLTAYPVFFAYAVSEWRNECRIRGTQLALAIGLVSLLLVPLFWYIFFVHHLTAESSWAGTPDSSSLLSSFLPADFATMVFFGVLVAYFACRTIGVLSLSIARSAEFLAVVWLIFPVITLFVVARTTPLKVFVPRYYLHAFAALALIVGCGIRMLTPGRIRVIIAGFIVFVAVISFAGYHLTMSPHREDWRAAAKLVQAAGISPTTPVLVRAGLVEGRDIRWHDSIDQDSPLLCPISRYPLPGHIVLLPNRFNAQGIRYMQELSSRVLAANDTFVVVTRKDEKIVSWMQGWFVGQGFEISELDRVEGVNVLLGRRIH